MLYTEELKAAPLVVALIRRKMLITELIPTRKSHVIRMVVKANDLMWWMKGTVEVPFSW